MSGVPDIPTHLINRPQSGGLVLPWITAQTRDGQYLFGMITDLGQTRCLTEYRCQVCAQRLPDRAVLFARESDLDARCTPEPATCPPCSRYSIRACPMLKGQMGHYRASVHPALAGIPVTAEQLLRQGTPAEPWYAVWVRGYNVITHPVRPDTLAASWQRIPPVRIRPLSPGLASSG